MAGQGAGGAAAEGPPRNALGAGADHQPPGGRTRAASTLRDSGCRPPRRVLARARVAGGSAGATILGLTPHVLHHVGPLAGAALLAGAGGKLIFGAVGLLAAIPMLLRMHRHTGSWRRPAAALAVFTALFALSSFVIGPALTDGRDDAPPPAAPESAAPPPEHQKHH